MQGGRIYLIGNEPDSLVAMNEQDFLAEDKMQDYLARYPDLLPGDQIDPDNPRRWLLVKREMGVPEAMNALGRWSIDHLFLDQDGIPTFVECKRAENTQVRREVVAQMLEYAANGLAYWSVEQLKKAAEATANARNTSSDALIRQLVPEGRDTAVEQFWANVELNLQAGRVRLVFVAERIPRELRRLVEFMNKNFPMIDVLAVELRQFVAGGQTALVPSLIGMTEEARVRKETQQRLDRETFLARVENPGAAGMLARLLDDAPKYGLTVAWHPTCFSIKVPVDGRSTGVVYAYRDRIEVYFGYLDLAPAEGQALREALLQQSSLWKDSENQLRLPLNDTVLAQSASIIGGLLAGLATFAQRHDAPRKAH